MMSTPAGAADLLARKVRKTGAPVAVVFQVTDRCNYECVHCYETHGENAELSLTEIDRILGEVAAEGTLFLTLTGGEFFMRRDADDVLRAARRHRFAVKLKTTGHFIDDRRADLIAELGAIAVDMSFYSGDPGVHDHVTQIAGSWQHTLDAARRLRDRGVIVKLNTPLMGLNADQLARVKTIAEALGCSFGFDPSVTAREDGSQAPTALRADDAALRRFYRDDQLGNPEALAGAFGHLSPERLRARDREPPCRAAQDTCGIGPQGLVSACHTLPVPAGDLTRQSFREVWRDSPQLQRIRALTWARIEECGTCEVRPYCGRCHAMALLEDGRLDGPSREACRHAVAIRDLLRDRGAIPSTETALPPTMRRGPGGPPGPIRPAGLGVLR